MRRTTKTYQRLLKRLDKLFCLLEANLGNRRQRQRKSRLREVLKLMTLLNHPGWRRS